MAATPPPVAVADPACAPLIAGTMTPPPVPVTDAAWAPFAVPTSTPPPVATGADWRATSGDLDATAIRPWR